METDYIDGFLLVEKIDIFRRMISKLSLTLDDVAKANNAIVLYEQQMQLHPLIQAMKNEVKAKHQDRINEIITAIKNKQSVPILQYHLLQLMREADFNDIVIVENNIIFQDMGYSFILLPRDLITNEMRKSLVNSFKQLARPAEGKLKASQSCSMTFDALTKYDLRVSFEEVKGVDGFFESLTIRLMAPSFIPINQQGHSEYNLEKLLDNSQSGIIVCGIPSAGKTTTVHAIISELARLGHLVRTTEDPIEYKLTHPLIVQAQINPQRGQDADNIKSNKLRQGHFASFMGEIRDNESVDIFKNNLMAGIKSLATLHANSIEGAFTRFRGLIGSVTELGMNNLAFVSTALARKQSGGKIAISDKVIVSPDDIIHIENILQDNQLEKYLVTEYLIEKGMIPKSIDAIVKALLGDITMQEAERVAIMSQNEKKAIANLVKKNPNILRDMIMKAANKNEYVKKCLAYLFDQIAKNSNIEILDIDFGLFAKDDKKQKENFSQSNPSAKESNSVNPVTEPVSGYNYMNSQPAVSPVVSQGKPVINGGSQNKNLKSGSPSIVKNVSSSSETPKAKSKLPLKNNLSTSVNKQELPEKKTIASLAEELKIIIKDYSLTKEEIQLINGILSDMVKMFNEEPKISHASLLNKTRDKIKGEWSLVRLTPQQIDSIVIKLVAFVETIVPSQKNTGNLIIDNVTPTVKQEASLPSLRALAQQSLDLFKSREVLVLDRTKLLKQDISRLAQTYKLLIEERDAIYQTMFLVNQSSENNITSNLIGQKLQKAFGITRYRQIDMDSLLRDFLILYEKYPDIFPPREKPSLTSRLNRFWETRKLENTEKNIEKDNDLPKILATNPVSLDKGFSYNQLAEILLNEAKNIQEEYSRKGIVVSIPVNTTFLSLDLYNLISKNTKSIKLIFKKDSYNKYSLEELECR